MVNGIDYLTCGSCQSEFPLANIINFMQHKYSCNIAESSDGDVSSQYLCFTCPKRFSAAISLLQHAQYQHRLSIFQEKRARGKEVPGILDEETPLRSIDAITVDAPLEKCCASIVPKKRKRHIEMKHKMGYRSKMRSGSARNIYINVDQSNMDEIEIGPRSSQGIHQPSIELMPGDSYTIPITSQPYLGISYSSQASPLPTTPVPPSKSSPELPASRATDSTSVTYSEPKLVPTTISLPPREPGNIDKSAFLDGLALMVSEDDPFKSDKGRVSAGKKQFNCDECGNSFKQRIHLKKHLSKHTGVKPFKCEQCNYATVERSHLKVHIRIHTGEKPFKCDHCEYATAQNSTLKIHLKRHHNASIECSTCGQIFLAKEALNRHTLDKCNSEPCLTMADSSIGVKNRASSAGLVVTGQKDSQTGAALLLN